MAHTVDAIVYDAVTGNLQMIVIPDDDAQLDDPAFNPARAVQARVPRLDRQALPAKGAPDAAVLTTLAVTAMADRGVKVQLEPAVAQAPAATDAAIAS